MGSAAFDFLVLGGGPAGAVFSSLAARDGARVLLAERHGYTARRPGEYVDGSIREIIEILGLAADALEKIAQPSPSIISLWDTDIPLDQSFRAGAGRPSVAVVRNAFDRLLHDTAVGLGTKIIRTDARLCITEGSNGWHVDLPTPQGSASAKIGCIVDASGRAAAISRRLGGSLERHGALYAMALWLRPDAPTGHAAGPLVVEAAVDGWWSLAETPGDDLVAVYYTHRGTLPARRGPRAQQALEALGHAPFIKGRLRRRGAKLVDTRSFAAFPARRQLCSGDRWIAIGDAAACYDPLCGKGS